MKVYSHTFLDLPHSVDAMTMAGLDVADDVLIVCNMTLPSIQNTIRAVETFHQLDYKKAKLKLIVNRYYDGDQISLREVSEHIQLPVFWVVPYDSPTAISAANSGQTLNDTDANSQASQSLLALAQQMAGIEVKKPKRKLFGFYLIIKPRNPSLIITINSLKILKQSFHLGDFPICRTTVESDSQLKKKILFTNFRKKN